MASKNPTFIEPEAGDEDFKLPTFDLGRSEVRMVPVSELLDPTRRRVW